ncbi:hypothetical protein Aperf_G00000067765 [Anoplocephala perfoliata]
MQPASKIPAFAADGDKNINCLLLASACYDNLGNEDKAVNMVHKVLMMDEKNVMAWQGLSRFCMKNTNRFYLLAAQCFLFLIPYYAREGPQTKRNECLANILRVIVRYRLELPLGLPSFLDTCNLVLAGDNVNPDALEAKLRLMVESALFCPFAEDSDCPKSFIVTFTGLNTANVDFGLMRLYTDRLSKRVADGSDTAHFTLALVESFLETCQFLQMGRYDSLRGPYTRLQRLSTHGIKVDERWQPQGFLDVHISALLAIINFSMNDFERCNFHVVNLLEFCLSAFAKVSYDITHFKDFPKDPPSTLSEFLTPRLLYTPIRIFGDSLPEGVNPLHRVFNWASCMLLSNAAKSNLKPLLASALKYYAEQCMTSEKMLVWPRPQTALFIECCITSNNVGLLQKYVDISSLTSSDIPGEYSTEVTLRIKLVKYLLSFCQRGSDKFSIAQEICKLKEFMGDPGFTSHNYNLAGRLLMKAPSTQIEDILDHFNRGIKADSNYFTNFLNIGSTFYWRLQDYRRAYQALKTAWQLAPGNPDIAHPLASALCKLGKFDKAYEVYNSVDVKSFSASMFLNYGLVSLRLKKLNRCIPALQRVVRVEPTNPLAWEILGEGYMARGNHGVALQALERSIKLDPNRPLPHILYAQACTVLSDYPTAVTAYDRVIKLLKNQKLHSLHLLANKGLVELNANLAIQELRSGMGTTAISHIEAALEIGASVLQEAPQNAPQWLWYYMGYIMTLPLVFHDARLRIRMPKMFISLFKRPPKLEEDEETFLVDVSTCADLSGIMLSLFIKSATNASMLREIVLAWICLGLLQLSRATYAQTAELENAVAKPLFEDCERLQESSKFALMQAETCFSKALEISKNMPPNSDQITALAWFAMGSTMALGRDPTGSRSAYSFSMAFQLCNKFLNAGICLASKLTEMGESINAEKVLNQCLDFEPKIHGYWFVMAQLAAIDAQKPQSSQFGQPNQLQCLMQAVEEGFIHDALWQVVPKMFQLLKRPFESKKLSSYEEENLRLYRLISAEYLNRCLAFYPNDYRQWHDRGLLLQLSGLRYPAHYCFKRAHDLVSKLDASDLDRLTVKAHYFLSSCQQGNLDEVLREEFAKNITIKESSSSGIHSAVALAQLSKGNLGAAKQAFMGVYRSLGINDDATASSCSLSCLVSALLEDPSAIPSPKKLEGELSTNLLASSINPLRRIVLAESLRIKTPYASIPSVDNLEAFLENPAYGYEWLLLTFSNSLPLKEATQILALVKTWAYLRPDKEPVWTLLATAQRLYADLEVTKTKKGAKVKALESAFSSLRSAAAVCPPDPTSEMLTQELVNYVNNAITSEQAAVVILKPLIIRSALLFPHVQGIPEALRRFL